MALAFQAKKQERVWGAGMKSVVEHIRTMSGRLVYYSNELDKIASDLEKDPDPMLAAQALNSIGNCISNLKMDILVTRIVRELRNDSLAGGKLPNDANSRKGA